MINTTKRSVRTADFEDAGSMNKLSLTVDIGEGLKKISLTLSQYGRKNRMHLPAEEILTITDPEELSELATFLIEILSESGVLQITGEETD